MPCVSSSVSVELDTRLHSKKIQSYLRSRALTSKIFCGLVLAASLNVSSYQCSSVIDDPTCRLIYLSQEHGALRLMQMNARFSTPATMFVLHLLTPRAEPLVDNSKF